MFPNIKPVLTYSRMIKFLVISAIISMISFSYAEHTNLSKPRFVAVFFEADWCASCKALAPKLTQAREQARVENEDILFISLNLTDESTSHQAAMLATSLCLKELYVKNNGKTGYIAIVEATSGKIISTVTKNYSVDEIIASIDISG